MNQIIKFVFAFTLANYFSFAYASLDSGVDAYQKGNYQKAYEDFLVEAKKQNAQAMFNLGVMYENGNFVEQNKYQALKWYEKAADNGHVGGSAVSGIWYMNAIGGNKNYFKASRLLEYASKNGDSDAQNSLAIGYMNGYWGYDYGKAFELLSKSAKQGNANARFNLADFYLKGHNVVNRNVTKAKSILNELGKDGYGIGYDRLGELNEKSKPLDALEYYQAAYEKGYSDSGRKFKKLYESHSRFLDGYTLGMFQDMFYPFYQKVRKEY